MTGDARRPGTLPVRGSCKSGHVYDTVAPLDHTGRQTLTWRGTCPVPGCGLFIVARRLPAGPATEATPPAVQGGSPKVEETVTPRTPARAATSRPTARKVAAYSDEPRPPRPPVRRDAPGVPAPPAAKKPDGPPAGEHAPQLGPVESPSSGTPAPPGRWRRHRPGDQLARPRREIVPGIYD